MSVYTCFCVCAVCVCLTSSPPVRRDPIPERRCHEDGGSGILEGQIIVRYIIVPSSLEYGLHYCDHFLHCCILRIAASIYARHCLPVCMHVCVYVCLRAYECACVCLCLFLCHYVYVSIYVCMVSCGMVRGEVWCVCMHGHCFPKNPFCCIICTYTHKVSNYTDLGSKNSGTLGLDLHGLIWLKISC